MRRNLYSSSDESKGSSGPPAEPCDCDKDPSEALKRLFVDFFQGIGLAAGRDPATRPVFLRLHGAAHGTFVASLGEKQIWQDYL